MKNFFNIEIGLFIFKKLLKNRKEANCPNKNINIIIFSKDRACQLELLLRSINKHWKESFEHKIKVLYTYSDPEYKKGYDILLAEYNKVFFIKENRFKDDLISLIEDKEYTIFFVDDIVFKEDFSLNENEVKTLEARKDILCLSLRLHPKLTYCYALDIQMEPINTNIWGWQGKIGDYGYPMSLDAHIFRTNQIKPLIKLMTYNNPNTLENAIANNPLNIPNMICFNKSKIVNNPCNIVQSSYKNRHGTNDGKYLNDKYLQDYRISLKNITGIEYNACHQEIDISFYKK